MSKNLVIVESPAKAKTIEKYLGADYKVLASVGHIRKDVKVDVHDNFAVTYEIDPDHKNIISKLKKKLKKLGPSGLPPMKTAKVNLFLGTYLKYLNFPNPPIVSLFMKLPKLLCSLP